MFSSLIGMPSTIVDRMQSGVPFTVAARVQSGVPFTVAARMQSGVPFTIKVYTVCRLWSQTDLLREVFITVF